MTPKEVVEWLEAIEKKHIHGGDESFDKKRKIAINNAIKAVEKQIPKKPVRKEFGKFYCSVCDDFLLHSNATKYCSRCGQAVDWNIVLMTEEECRELVLRKLPEYRISRIEEDENYYEVCISKIDGWTTRVLLVKKISGFVRELGV